MAINRRAPFPSRGVVGRRGVMHLYHTVTLGSSTAVSSQDAERDSGVVAATTGATTGRLTLTILGGKPVRQFLGGDVALIIGNTAAATTADGNNWAFRANDLDGNNLDGTIELQFQRSDTSADAAPTSGTVAIIHLVVDL